MEPLHYTAAQLRFAFLLLIHDDAKPHFLHERHANLMMKDFLDRGITKPDATHMLRRELLRVWMALGYPQMKFKENARCSPPTIVVPEPNSMR